MIRNLYPHRDNGRSYLGAGVASILIVLIVLVIGAFAALTYVSADNKADLASKGAKYCTDYYAAETVASQLLNNISSSSGKVGVSNGSKNTYDTDLGAIEVTRADRFVTFAVPISDKQELAVEANITGKKVQIIKWAVE
ncbi:MAG: hypothetical protein KBS66_01515 [Eubacterium sp.]|nr:hypothetical protein [Candidatus Colimonas fimequi]